MSVWYHPYYNWLGLLSYPYLNSLQISEEMLFHLNLPDQTRFEEVGWVCIGEFD